MNAMAKSGRPKTKTGRQKAEHANGAGSGKPYEEADLIRAINHPLRRQILRLLHSSEDPLSPTQIEQTLELGHEPKESLSTVSYHVRALAEVGRRQVRGAMEHFYASQVSDCAWVCHSLKKTRKSDEASLRPTGSWRKGKRATKKGEC
jgi:hypothetical protein